jgi:uncharacterized repeat protein (TIGR01451 family)
MKNILLALSVLMVALGTCIAQNGDGFALHVGKQRIVIESGPASAQEAGKIFIVSAKPDGPSGKEAKPYGLRLAGTGKSPLSQPCIELIDARTKQTVRKISAGELFGKESAGWKSVPSQTVTGEGKTVSAFAFTADHQQFTFTRTLQSVSDEHLPEGKGVSMTFAVTSEKPMEMSMRLSAACDGASGAEGHSWFVGDSLNGEAGQAMVVMTAGPASSVACQAPKRKGEPALLTIESKSAQLPASAKTELLTLTIAGTTVGAPAHTLKQARNIMGYFNTQAPKPELAAITSVDRPHTISGDTLTYTIEYHNIGTAPGKDVEINNPMPSGARYLEDSAEGDGGAVTVARSAQNDAVSIQWKSAAAIQPGEHRSVRFKVVIQ